MILSEAEQKYIFIVFFVVLKVFSLFHLLHPAAVDGLPLAANFTLVI